MHFVRTCKTVRCTYSKIYFPPHVWSLSLHTLLDRCFPPHVLKFVCIYFWIMCKVAFILLQFGKANNLKMALLETFESHCQSQCWLMLGWTGLQTSFNTRPCLFPFRSFSYLVWMKDAPFFIWSLTSLFLFSFCLKVEAESSPWKEMDSWWFRMCLWLFSMLEKNKR